MNRSRHPLSDGHPPTWAESWGQDRYGVFAGFRVGEVEHRFRWMPPGDFLMGSPEDEGGRVDSEGPQHPVKISRGFWLGETVCTQELWREVMGENPSRFQSAKRPVERVSWAECQSFLEKLNGRLPGVEARLPTEAEWEYACRADTQMSSYAGELEILGEANAPLLDEIAWYRGNSGVDFDLEKGYDSSEWSEKQYPHQEAGTRQVALKKPNPWGLYDMLGNVYEWCEDKWNLDGYPGTKKREDPLGSVGSYRVFRGGSWLSLARLVRASSRYGDVPGYRYFSVGFRLARGQDRHGR